MTDRLLAPAWAGDGSRNVEDTLPKRLGDNEKGYLQQLGLFHYQTRLPYYPTFISKHILRCGVHIVHKHAAHTCSCRLEQPDRSFDEVNPLRVGLHFGGDCFTGCLRYLVGEKGWR